MCIEAKLPFCICKEINIQVNMSVHQFLIVFEFSFLFKILFKQCVQKGLDSYLLIGEEDEDDMADACVEPCTLKLTLSRCQNNCCY